MMNLLVKENNAVTGYAFARTKHDKKENAIVIDTINFAPFKNVADHANFCVLVQNVVTYRELVTLRSTIAKLEELEIQNFGLDEKQSEQLSVARLKLELATKISDSLEIPDSWKNKHISEYPASVLLLANWIDGIIPQFPIEKIKTLSSIVTSELVENGKVDMSEDFIKEVADLLKDFYAPIYNTVKDSIFKKWTLKFDLKGVRQLLLSCGLVTQVNNGKFEYGLVNDEKIRQNVAHALLRRMQKDNADK